jgi:cytochrome c556
MKKPITAAAAACGILFASFALDAQQRGQRGEQPPAPPAQPGQPPAAAPAAPAPKPLVPVAASTLAAHPETYYGERVTMTGAIEQSLGKLAFSVDQDKTKTTEQQILVLAPRLNNPVDPNTYITVIGEAVAFDSAELAKRAKDYPVEISPELAAKYKGRPMIFATNVINTSGVDLAARLPPPMTAEEQALQKVMKAIAPASAALRADADKMDVNLTKEHAATLKQAFTQTELIWKAKGKADAVQMAADARKLAETIELDAAAAKWDEVKTSAGTLNTKCGACHGIYRERFDDGSFRIKIPPTGTR